MPEGTGSVARVLQEMMRTMQRATLLGRLLRLERLLEQIPESERTPQQQRLLNLLGRLTEKLSDGKDLNEQDIRLLNDAAQSADLTPAQQQALADILTATNAMASPTENTSQSQGSQPAAGAPTETGERSGTAGERSTPASPREAQANQERTQRERVLNGETLNTDRPSQPARTATTSRATGADHSRQTGQPQRVEITLTAERLLREIEQIRPFVMLGEREAPAVIESLVRRTLAEEFRFEGSERIFEMLARLLTSLVIERIVREAAGTETRASEFERAVRKAIDQLNRELADLTIEMSARPGTGTKNRIAEERREEERAEVRRIERRRTERTEAERTQAERTEIRRVVEGSPERVAMRVTYDGRESRESVRVEIDGSGHRIPAETLKNLAAARPAEIIPRLIETAIRVIESSPESQTEILRFVSETLAAVFPREILGTPVPASVPQASEPVARVIEFPAISTRTNAPVPTPTPTTPPQSNPAGAAQNATAPESVMEVVVQTIITEHERTKTSPQDRESRLEVARAIFQKAPEAALPALLKAYSQAPLPAREVLSPEIVKLAQTEEGRQYVLAAFAQGKQEPLVSSEIGQAVIIQTVQKFVDVAKQSSKTKPADKAGPEEQTFSGRNQTQQLQQVVRSQAAANLKNLPEKLTIGSARSFIELVVQAQKCVQLIGIKDLAKLEKQMAMGAREQKRKTAPPTLRPSTPVSGSAKKAAPGKASRAAGKSPEVRTALRELVRISEESRLVLSKDIYSLIGNHFAGLAGFSGINDKRIIPAFEAAQTPAESRATASMKRVVAALEAEAARGVGKDVQTAAKAAAHSAEYWEDIIKGMILAKVRMERSKAREMLRALAEKGYLLSDLVNAVEENYEGVVDFINLLALETNLKGYKEELPVAA